MMMTPSARRSTAISRASHWILRNAGFACTAAAWTFMLVLSPRYRFFLPLAEKERSARIARCEPGEDHLGVASHGPPPRPSPFQGEGELPRRHADCAIKADGLAVDHRI